MVLRDTGSIGMMAAAMVFVMTTGEIDLSIGAIYGLCPYIMSLLATYWLLPLWLAAVCSMAIGSFIGFVNGFISVKTRVPSLIITLGTFFLSGRRHSYHCQQPTNRHADYRNHLT